MKKFKKYIILIVLFVVVMISILVFFIFRYEKIHLLNRSRVLLNYLYTLDEGEYSFKSGMIHNGTNVLDTTYYFDGSGKIKVDKYKNVSFNISSGEYCVSKTALNKIEINKCGELVNIDVNVVKNNNIISFNVNSNDLDYMISDKDDFKGKWIHKDYKDSIIIKSYDTSKHYIWFRDSDGNVSDVYTYQVECFLGNKGEYVKDKYYCEGSVVEIDNINYIVINDREEDITLMKQNPIEEKLSQCTSEVSEYCYYTENETNKYKWSNSYINYYLNNVYIKTLSNDLVSKIKEDAICDDFINVGCTDNEGCGGYTEEEITKNNYTCNNYSKSKIRIISYNEYVKLYDSVKNKSILKGNYWIINNGIDDFGSSVLYNSNVYVKEKFVNKLDIKPVFTISKY